MLSVAWVMASGGKEVFGGVPVALEVVRIISYWCAAA